MKSASAILVLFFLTFFIQPIQAQEKSAEGPFDQTIIRGVTLINGNGAPSMGPVDVVVEQNVITQVRVVGFPGVAIDDDRRPELEEGGKEIDAHGMYLLPSKSMIQIFPKTAFLNLFFQVFICCC